MDRYSTIDSHTGERERLTGTNYGKTIIALFPSTVDVRLSK